MNGLPLTGAIQNILIFKKIIKQSTKKLQQILKNQDQLINKSNSSSISFSEPKINIIQQESARKEDKFEEESKQD